MKKSPAALILAAVIVIAFLGGCASSPGGPARVEPPGKAFPTSLHTRADGGMAYWYAKGNGGFERETGIPFKDLACKGCHHTGACDACHKLPPPSKVGDESCLTCHTRQGAEGKQGYTDLHRQELGMRCRDCHSSADVHGDGKRYDTLFDRPQVRCEKCHPQVKSHLAHDIHADRLDCSSCHMKTVVTCYNCHFESQVNGKEMVFNAQFKDFMFLVNRGGKVVPGNMHTVTYQGKSFVVISAFHSHTIVRKGHDCKDCHNSPALTEYEQGGKMTVSRWDQATGKLEGPSGIYPLPPDYATALKFDFVDLKDGNWVFLKSGADRIQMIEKYGAPLTTEQMRKLSANKY